ncbi:MAG TPA: alkaline phosphatase family protein [Solirubrobacterales bacterium]|nr:alkaline phosphatase family protein [Solirubrobacterales bacterium]
MSPPPEEVTPPVDEKDALDRLRSVKHIVVLMMENRSFDQMLGFLENDDLDVNGLGKERAKTNYIGEEPYDSFEWARGQTTPKTPPGHKPKILDPCHSPACVREQLTGDNTGFVKNFAETRKDEHGHPVKLDREFLEVPMGYFGPNHLPVYRHLAHNFCVCDAWHSSIPGDTWPNRLYSLAGREGPSIGHKPGLLGELIKDIKGLPLIGGIAGAPIFEVEAFTRQLHDSQWRWYSHDPATLRAADKLYRDFRHIKRDNFAYFNRKKLSLETQALEAAIVSHDSFLDDAAKGELRDVSWIDPNFIDLSVLDPNSNDDHPPSDVKAGQALVLEIYEALASSPNWEDTVLVIVYDEHGGFYDHVKPPPVSDSSGYPSLGVRVPALVVGPRVRNAVFSETLEHTSLIATILQRFAANPAHALQAMPERAQKAKHLGWLLAANPRTDLAGRGDLHKEMAEWRHNARVERRAGKGVPSPAADGAGHDFELHDFQHEFAKFALAMRDAGLPPGQP